MASKELSSPKQYKVTNVVGPGAYYAGFTKQVRFKRTENGGCYPGPGKYNPGDSTLYSSPEYSIAQKFRSQSPDWDTPAPNTYNPQKPLISHGGSVFPKSEFEGFDEGFPGPGEYDPISLDIVKPQLHATKFSGRDDQWFYPHDQTPGVGQYSLVQDNGYAKTPGVTIGKAKRVSWTQNQHARDSPGPADYNIPVEIDYGVEKNKGPTMLGKDEFDWENEVPGPGSYNAKDNLTVKGNKPHLGRMSKASTKRDEILKSDTPGPSEYVPDQCLVKKSSQKSTIGSSRRKDPKLSFLENPCPNAYDNIAENIGENKPAFSMRLMLENENKIRGNENGPGDYSPRHTQTKKRAEAYSIGKESKSKDPNPLKNTPGPGDYSPELNTVKENTQAITMPRSKRGEFVNPNSTPGAADYMIPSELEVGLKDKKGTTLSSRYMNLDQKNSNPGPNVYSPKLEQTKPRPQSCKFPKEKRGAKRCFRLEPPGPGEYYPKIVKLRRQPQWKIGTSKRFQEEDPEIGTFFGQTGPAQYDVRKDIGDSQGKPIFGLKPMNITKIDMKPGPGAYDAEKGDRIMSMSKNAPSFSFAKTSKLKDKLSEDDLIGPGYYNVKVDAMKEKSSAIKFNYDLNTTASTNQSSYYPGPGSYTPGSLFSSGLHGHVKGPSLSSRHAPTGQAKTPGPGDYTPLLTQTGSRVKGAKIDPIPLVGGGKNECLEGPSPCSYTPSFEHVLRQSKGITFTKEKKLEKDDRPVNDAISSCLLNNGSPQKDKKGPKIGTEKRWKDEDEGWELGFDAGGLGAGQIQNFAVDGEGRGGIIGGDSRWRSKADERPGPGAYYLNPLHEGIKYSIPREVKKEPINDNPGPGEYKLKPDFADVPDYLIKYQDKYWN